ncbi:phospholipase D family protein [Cohnella zeiphila]|uniref:phospholipase D n=1 Tax=Cohnella zeiphila TaxID=2761120 RepID=A0A7X0SRY2_9BACL|nr:phospholipase D family protein [Cohnella zeiphila]MBB6735027.1 phospholipase D family protein [Cohnella zeiphila]
MKKRIRGWMPSAALAAALAVGMASALAGCSVGAGDQAASAALGEKQVAWAFTQADQHPERELIQVIDGAESTLDIAIYSLTYPDIVQAIRNAAKRGVRVRLISDRIQSNGKTQKEALKLLGSAGIPLKINKHSGLMHLKVTVADGKVATTGSFNYSKSASTDNDEVFLVLRDETVAASFEKEFETMWNDEKRFESLQAGIALPEEQSDGENEESDEQKAAVSDAPASCDNPRIKGNINAKGDKIYHVPGGAQYDRTKAEEMFCTEQEATAAGFRKAQN